MTDCSPEASAYGQKTARFHGFPAGHVAEALFAEGYDDGARAAEARVRTQVAQELLRKINENPVPWSPDTVRRVAAALGGNPGTREIMIDTLTARSAITAAALDSEGDLWVQLSPSGSWFCPRIDRWFADPRSRDHMEDAFGPTRRIQVAAAELTGTPKEPA